MQNTSSTYTDTLIAGASVLWAGHVCSVDWAGDYMLTLKLIDGTTHNVQRFYTAGLQTLCSVKVLSKSEL